MADTKISALTAGAPALSTDELPAARSGTNVKLLVSDLATFIGTNNVLPQTLAQAQSNNGTYTKGSWVQVTQDIGSITGSVNTIFPVIEGGFLAGTGWCQTFRNAGMAATRMVEIDWDVTSDFISRIKEPIQGNTVTAHYSSVGLENFPFDTSTMFGVNLIDPNVCNIDVAAIVGGSTFEEYGTITLGAGTTFRGTAGQEATVTLSGTATFIGSVGDNGGVTLIGTQALNWCKIGVNKNVDCSGLVSTYTQTEAVIDGPNSTFEITSTDSAAVNPDVTGTIDMADFQFAGVLRTDDGTNNLTDYINVPTDHEWIIDPIAGSGVNVEDRTTGAAGNIWINTTALTTVQLHGDDLEFMVFMAARNSPTQVVVKYYTNTA
jgi:hypothetical protein